MFQQHASSVRGAAAARQCCAGTGRSPEQLVLLAQQPNAVCRCATLATRGRTFGRGIASVGRPALPRATLRLRQGMGSPGSRAMANVAAWPLTPAACALAPSSQQAELAAPQSRHGTHARAPSAPIRLLAQGPGAWTSAEAQGSLGDPGSRSRCSVAWARRTWDQRGWWPPSGGGAAPGRDRPPSSSRLASARERSRAKRSRVGSLGRYS